MDWVYQWMTELLRQDQGTFVGPTTSNLRSQLTLIRCLNLAYIYHHRPRVKSAPGTVSMIESGKFQHR